MEAETLSSDMFLYTCTRSYEQYVKKKNPEIFPPLPFPPLSKFLLVLVFKKQNTHDIGFMGTELSIELDMWVALSSERDFLLSPLHHHGHASRSSFNQEAVKVALHNSSFLEPKANDFIVVYKKYSKAVVPNPYPTYQILTSQFIKAAKLWL